jgi:hypothetical protein
VKRFVQLTARIDMRRQYEHYLELDRPDLADRFFGSSGNRVGDFDRGMLGVGMLGVGALGRLVNGRPVPPNCQGLISIRAAIRLHLRMLCSKHAGRGPCQPPALPARRKDSRET